MSTDLQALREEWAGMDGLDRALWLHKHAGLPKRPGALRDRNAIAQAEDAVGRMGLGMKYADTLAMLLDLVAPELVGHRLAHAAYGPRGLYAVRTAPPELAAEALYLTIRQHKGHTDG